MELTLSDCMPAEQIYQALDHCSQRTLDELKMLGLTDRMTQEELIQICSMTSEQAYNELVGLNIFGPVLTFEQIMQLCSGTDAEGLPNSFGVLTVDTITDDMGAVSYASVSFGNPIINLYGAGGCVVVTADFKASNMFEYRRARDILNEWFEKKNKPEFDRKLLSLVISPVLLNGELVTIFHEVVYAQGVPVGDNTYRLIMAFDNIQTQEILASNIRLDELKASVTEEIARREAEEKAALIEAQREMEAMGREESNPYAEAVMREYLNNEVNLSDASNNENPDADTSGKKEKGSEWMRFTKD